MEAFPKPAKPVRLGRQQPDLVWTSTDISTLRRPTFRRYFPAELASDVQSWLEAIRDPDQPLRWISYLQLFISFQFRRGPWALSKPQGKWHAEKGETARLADHARLSVRIKHFRLMLQQFLIDAEVHHATGTVRPYIAIGCHVSEVFGISAVG